jgi:hypothetical protein
MTGGWQGGGPDQTRLGSVEQGLLHVGQKADWVDPRHLRSHQEGSRCGQLVSEEPEPRKFVVQVGRLSCQLGDCSGGRGQMPGGCLFELQ